MWLNGLIINKNNNDDGLLDIKQLNDRLIKTHRIYKKEECTDIADLFYKQVMK